MTLQFDQSMIWHVVFHPSETWWARRFQHVSLAGFTNDTWLHLDLRRGGVNASTIHHYEEVEDFLTFILHHCTVLHFGPATGEKAYQFFRPMTCVSFTKHVLGVQSSALRPDGLFHDLMRIPHVSAVNEDAEGRRDTGTEGTAQAR